jgi:hypothetical protein
LVKLCSPAIYLKHKVGAKSSTSCRSESSNISLAGSETLQGYPQNFF